MSKDRWFEHYERRLNEHLAKHNERWPTTAESHELTERARQDQIDDMALQADRLEETEDYIISELLDEKMKDEGEEPW